MDETRADEVLLVMLLLLLSLASVVRQLPRMTLKSRPVCSKSREPSGRADGPGRRIGLDSTVDVAVWSITSIHPSVQITAHTMPPKTTIQDADDFDDDTDVSMLSKSRSPAQRLTSSLSAQTVRPANSPAEHRHAFDSRNARLDT